MPQQFAPLEVPPLALVPAGMAPGGLVPQQVVPPGGGGVAQVALPDDAPIPFEDPRFHIYYHLCCIFPEAQVRTAMNRSPSVLNPQTVCATILQHHSNAADNIAP